MYYMCVKFHIKRFSRLDAVETQTNILTFIELN